MVDSAGQAVATSPLLETKLYVPRWRTALVPRPRLIERLVRGTEGKLTLISAPPGFGKTTLLAEWLAATPVSERPAAWVSLDQSDNDPALFWAYFITALQKVQSEVGESALSLRRYEGGLHIHGRAGPGEPGRWHDIQGLGHVDALGPYGPMIGRYNRFPHQHDGRHT